MPINRVIFELQSYVPYLQGVLFFHDSYIRERGEGDSKRQGHNSSGHSPRYP